MNNIELKKLTEMVNDRYKSMCFFLDAYGATNDTAKEQPIRYSTLCEVCNALGYNVENKNGKIVLSK